MNPLLILFLWRNERNVKKKSSISKTRNVSQFSVKANHVLWWNFEGSSLKGEIYYFFVILVRFSRVFCKNKFSTLGIVMTEYSAQNLNSFFFRFFPPLFYTVRYCIRQTSSAARQQIPKKQKLNSNRSTLLSVRSASNNWTAQEERCFLCCLCIDIITTPINEH